MLFLKFSDVNKLNVTNLFTKINLNNKNLYFMPSYLDNYEDGEKDKEKDEEEKEKEDKEKGEEEESDTGDFI